MDAVASEFQYPTGIHSFVVASCCRNFFEMVRFDFVLDENAKVFLMEVCDVRIIMQSLRVTLASFFYFVATVEFVQHMLPSASFSCPTWF